jgi:hypothetical protein
LSDFTRDVRASIPTVGAHPDHFLELPDQKTRAFLVSIIFKRLFPEHAHKVFGEMIVRI